MKSFFSGYGVNIPELSNPVDYILNLINMSENAFANLKNCGESGLKLEYSSQTLNKISKVIIEN